MKRRSREISIFSMSALDLFASALGAFILIAIVIFPYFPNTSLASPSPPVPAPACPPVRPCPPVPDPAPPTTQFPHLDLVIALDVSGSMGDEIARLKAEVDQLSSVLIGLTPSLGMGVVAFGDRRWARAITSFGLREISAANQAAFRDFVLGLEVNMGLGGGSNPDTPEAFRQALTAAAGMRWRPRAESRMIVLITDAPAYPEEVARAVAEARSFGTAPGQRVSTVGILHRYSASSTEAFLEGVATAGNGQFLRDTGGSITATLLLSMM